MRSVSHCWNNINVVIPSTLKGGRWEAGAVGTNHFLMPSEDMDEQPSFSVVEEANARHLQFFELLRSTSVHDYVSVGDIIFFVCHS